MINFYILFGESNVSINSGIKIEMRTIILAALFIFSGFLVLHAQTYETISELQPIPVLKAKKSKKQTCCPEYIDFPAYIDFDLKGEVIVWSNSINGFALVIDIPNKEIVFEDINEISEAYLNIYGRVISEDRKINGFFEEKLLIKFDKNTKEEAMKKISQYKKNFELPASGKYKIDVIVTDKKSGNRGIQSRRFEISASK